jgi:hypothetical protein
VKKELVLGIIGTLTLAGVASAQPGPPPPPRPTQPAPIASEATPVSTPSVVAEKDPWEQWVENYYKILKVRKGMEQRVDEMHAYPDPRVRALMEIVGEDEEYVYLRNLPLEDPRSSGHRGWLLHEGVELKSLLREEFLADRYLLENKEIEVPPPFTDRIRFEERSDGLPKEGLWQIGFDAGDFDGDGRLDLVLPPARKGAPHPWILLNKPDGWKIWQEVKWPDIPLDYGDVKVADFDGDRNLDIAIANHFKKAYVMYGNGQGDFTRCVELPNANPDVTSRTIAVADFNGDGRPDVVQLAELDADIATGTQRGSGLVTVDLNLPSGWSVSPGGFPPNLYGDHVTVGDFNGDGKPDILVASHKAQNDAYIFVNDGKGTTFAPYRSKAFPWNAYVLGVAAGSLDGRKPLQAILGVNQTVRPQMGEYFSVHALLAYRLGDARGKPLPEPSRRLLYRDQRGDYNMFRAVTVGDLDGDGRPDIVAVRASGEVLVLLQDSNGNFLVQRSPELNLGDPSPSTVMIRDLDGDGRGELVANFSDGKSTPGSVRVWKVVRTTAAKAGRKAATSTK